MSIPGGALPILSRWRRILRTPGGSVMSAMSFIMTFTCQFSVDLEVPRPFRKTDAFLPSGHRPTMSRSHSCVDWPMLLADLVAMV